VLAVCLFIQIVDTSAAWQWVRTIVNSAWGWSRCAWTRNPDEHPWQSVAVGL